MQQRIESLVLTSFKRFSIVQTQTKTSNTFLRTFVTKSTNTTNQSKMASMSMAEKTQAQTGMSIIDIIKQDHRDALQQYEIYKSAMNKEDKKHAASMAIKLISVHSICEEQVLYPAFRKKIPNGDSIADQCLQEHQELKNDLYDLDKMTLEDAEFETKFHRVAQEVTTHGLQHEETEFLPMFSKYCTQDELVEFGKHFLAQRAMAPTRPHPMAPTNPILQKVVGTAALPIDKMKDVSEGV
jgi:hypothetical protein